VVACLLGEPNMRELHNRVLETTSLVEKTFRETRALLSYLRAMHEKTRLSAGRIVETTITMERSFRRGSAEF